MEPTYYSLRVSIYRVDEVYQVELSHRDPNSDAQVAAVRGPASFDLGALMALQADGAAYGRALIQQLLGDTDVASRFMQVETAAQASSSFLRVLICIDPSAQELQSLRWELLRHPQTDAVVANSEQVLLSRFMVSRDFRPVKLRARQALRALVAVSAPNPAKLERMQLAPVDYAHEAEPIATLLRDAGLSVVRGIGGPDSPLTLERLLDTLREGYDVVYLVSHGMFGASSGVPALVFTDAAGEATIVKGEELTDAIAQLQQPPRLMVLASCQSAGTGVQLAASQRTTVQATLAGRLADAGVPAVIAMQGYITMRSVELMMPTLFTELLRDGQIDRALAAARSKLRERDDAWMPALFSRLESGRLWYTPGFRGDKGKEVWRRLLTPVALGKLVPIIGPRLLESAYGSSYDTAERLAGAIQYPFASHDWDDLPRVTEYMSVKESRFNVIRAYQDQLLTDLIAAHQSWLPAQEVPPANPKPRLGKLLALVGERLRSDANDPYRILAELPASVYVTTNFDPLLEAALAANERPAQQLSTRWRYQKAPRSAADEPSIEPLVKAPLVYHVYGAFGGKGDDSLVLTEDNYFDYLIETAAAKLLPLAVENALVDNSLLFLGFRLTDWHFRVLFRLMMSLPGRERLKQYCHVAVQLDPDLERNRDVEGVKEYLAQYFGKEANIDIFWGSSSEFLVALRDELAAAGDLNVDEPPAPEDDDEWNF